MTRILIGMSALALVTALSACNKSEAPADNSVAADDMNATGTDSGNPFADAEMNMSRTMMAAVGSDAGQSWARKMIAHHQGAIDMSQIALASSLEPDVARMARDGIEKQRADITAIMKLLKEAAPNQASGDLYRPAMMDMEQKMQAAAGSNLSQTFMRKMLEHHKGAVAMSDVALKNGVSGALRDQIEKTRMENEKEARMTEAMLRGVPMKQAMATAEGKPPAEEEARPIPAEKSAATKPGAATADPHAGMNMNNM